MKAKSGDFEFEGTPDEIIQVTLGIVRRSTFYNPPPEKLVPTVTIHEEGKEPLTYTHKGVIEATFPVPDPEPVYKRLRDPQGQPIPRGVIDPETEKKIKIAARRSGETLKASALDKKKKNWQEPKGSRQEQILRAFKDSANLITAPLVCEVLGINSPNAATLLKELHDKKHIARAARGEYRITPAGRARVA